VLDVPQAREHRHDGTDRPERERQDQSAKTEQQDGNGLQDVLPGQPAGVRGERLGPLHSPYARDLPDKPLDRAGVAGVSRIGTLALDALLTHAPLIYALRNRALRGRLRRVRAAQPAGASGPGSAAPGTGAACASPPPPGSPRTGTPRGCAAQYRPSPAHARPRGPAPRRGRSADDGAVLAGDGLTLPRRYH